MNVASREVLQKCCESLQVNRQVIPKQIIINMKWSVYRKDFNINGYFETYVLVGALAVMAVRNMPHLIGSRIEKYWTSPHLLICPCSTTSKLRKETALPCPCFCLHLLYVFYLLEPTRFYLVQLIMSMVMSWWWTKNWSSKRKNTKSLKTKPSWLIQRLKTAELSISIPKLPPCQ